MRFLWILSWFIILGFAPLLLGGADLPWSVVGWTYLVAFVILNPLLYRMEEPELLKRWVAIFAVFWLLPILVFIFDSDVNFVVVQTCLGTVVFAALSGFYNRLRRRGLAR